MTAIRLPRPILEARNLGLVFGGRHPVTALADVSFSLQRGRALALVGESGSGKSSCAKLLTRMIAPTAGRILFDGEDVTEPGGQAERDLYRTHVQMVFQDPFAALNPAHSVAHHILRPLALHQAGLAKPARHARAAELLALVGLEDPAIPSKYPHELSGGQRQRVNLARALAVEPSVIIADEPTSMLDVSIRLSVLDTLAALKRERGIALLYITHDIATARYVAEDTAVIYGGRIVEMGPTAEIIDAPRHAYTKLLLDAVPEVGLPVAAGGGIATRAEKVRALSRTEGELAEVAPGHWVRFHRAA